MNNSSAHPRRYHRSRDGQQISRELAAIQSALKAQGWKSRRSLNDARAWKLTRDGSEGFYLLRCIAPGEWIVQPDTCDQEFADLRQLVLGALPHA